MSDAETNSLFQKSPTPTWRPITMPEIGSGEQIVRVSAWLTEIDEDVVAEDAIVEVLLKGVTFDVEAPATGILRRIDFTDEDRVATGDVLGWIEPTS